MTKPIGVGIVGAGMIGQLAHLANFITIPGCRVVAIADLRPELRRQAAQLFGVAKTYPAHEELIADDEVDAVVVVTRRPATGPVVLDALKARKHVLSEKPMAHTVEQGRCLVEEARRSDVRYAIGYMKRHDPGLDEGKRLFDKVRTTGELGPIHSIRVYNFGGDFYTPCRFQTYVMTNETRPDGLNVWPAAPSWIPSGSVAEFAAFLNVYSHNLNALRYMLGAVPLVTNVEVREDQYRILFNCGEFPALLETAESATGPWREGIEVQFEKGALAITFPSPMDKSESACVTLTANDQIFSPDVVRQWAFHRQAEAFVRDVSTGSEPLASGADSLLDLVLAEEIWRRRFQLAA